MAFFRTATRREIHYKDIAQAIHTLHPHLDGKHIFQQIDALGLRKEFDEGHTPYSLPYSFTSYLETEHGLSA